MYGLRRTARVVLGLLLLAIRIRFAQLIYGVCWIFDRKTARSVPGRLVREEFERLGGLFVKFGQIMAMRVDLFPPAFATELSLLLDKAPEFDVRLAEAIIESELGQPVEALFERFEREPLAAASFAQVHKARLKTGERVVVKIQRPGIRAQVAVDVRLLRVIATLVDWSTLLGRLRLRTVIDDFVDWTLEELDYLTEATHSERLRESNTGKTATFPAIHWDFCTSRIITMELVEGVWVSEILAAIERDDQAKLDRFTADGIDLEIVARNLFHSLLAQAFEAELFHADPHAGNLCVQPDNIIAFIDLGIIGQLGDYFRETQLRLLEAIESGRLDRYARALMRLFAPPPVTTDVDEFQEQVKRNARRWLNNHYNPRAELREKSTAYLITTNMSLARQHGLVASQMAVRYYRALLVAELIVLRLAPGFDVRVELRTFFVRLGMRTSLDRLRPGPLVLQRLTLRHLLSQIPENTVNLFDLADREIKTLRTDVSNVRLAFSRLFWLASIAALLCALVFLLAHILPLQTISRFALLERLRSFGTTPFEVGALVAGALLSAWLARFLSVHSVNNGNYVQH